MPAAYDLTGQQFGRWTVIKKVSLGKWECICSCSEKTVKVVYQKHLSSGASASCGCIRREMTIARNTTHGLSNDRDFQLRYKAEYRKKHRKHILKYAKAYSKRPGMKEHKKDYMATYRKGKKEYLKEQRRDYAKRNPEAIAELSARRRALKKQAIPKWGFEETKVFFKELKATAIKLEKDTGVKYHIDHIVPLCGMIDGVQVVSGLHVYSNLQLLQASDNCSKGPRLWPNMPDSML